MTDYYFWLGREVDDPCPPWVLPAEGGFALGDFSYRISIMPTKDVDVRGPVIYYSHESPQEEQPK